MNTSLAIQIRITSRQALQQINQLTGAVSGFTNTLGRGSRTADVFGAALGTSRITAMGSRMQWMGRQIEYNFSRPLIDAGKALTQFYMLNEAATARMKKVYGDAERGAAFYKDEIKALDGAFDALSSRFGVHKDQVIDTAAEWAAAGASGLALAKATDLTMKTMILGEMNAKDATKALIATQAQYGVGVDDLTKIVATLNMVENQTGVSLAGLIQAFSKSAGVARTAGIDWRELSAMIAALVPRAASAAEAGNSLKTIISRLFAPTRDMVAVMGHMGIAVGDAAWQSQNGTQRLETLAVAFSKLSGAQKNAAATVLAGRFQFNRMDALLDDIASKTGYYRKALEATASSQAVMKQLQIELNTVLESSPRKLEILKTMLINAGVKAITPMIPVLLYLVTMLQKAATWFGNLGPGIQKTVVASLSFIAAFGIGLRIWGAALVLLGYLRLLFVDLVGPIARLTRALLGLFGIALYGALVPISLAVRLIGVMAAKAIVLTVGVYGKALAAIYGLTTTLLAASVTALRSMALLAFQSIASVVPGVILALRRAYVAAIPVTFAIVQAWQYMVLAMSTTFSLLPTIVGGIVDKLAIVLYDAMFVMSMRIRKIWAALQAWIAMASIAVGPTIALAWNLLVTEMLILYYRTIATIQAATAAMAPIMAAAWAGITTAWSVVMGAVVSVTMAAVGMVRTIWAAGFVGLEILFRAALARLVSIVAVFGSALSAAWTATLATLRALTMAGWALIASATRIAMFNIRVAIAVGGAMATTLWASMLAAMRGITVSFAVAMSFQWARILGAIRAFSAAAWTAMTGPWGIAIAGVIALLIIFRKEIANVWRSIVENTAKIWGALPQAVKAPLVAVANFVKRAALEVYEWMQYLNPFARHSPSLVDNVRNGMAAVMSGFSVAEQISGIMRRAGFSVKSFGETVASIKRMAEMQEIADQLDDMREAAPELIGPFSRLVSTLQPLRGLLSRINALVQQQSTVVDTWKGSLDKANLVLDRQKDKLQKIQDVASAYQDRLSAAQQRLSDFANAPIKGLGKMEDAIFNNEMQSKKLRLALMKMEDAVGPMDTLEKRIDSLNGAMELTSGKKKSLVGAGAGSEITKGLDAQLKALERQKSATQKQLDPMIKLSREIDKLGRKAEMLDLEKSLKFDPLRRAIDKVANSVRELPFDKIINGVRSSKLEVDKLTKAYDLANRAAARQKIAVDAQQRIVDAIKARYDLESSVLQNLKDRYQQVEDQIRAVEEAIRSMTSAAQKAAQKKKKKESISPGEQNFLDAGKGEFPGVGGHAQIGREGGLEDQSKAIEEFTRGIQQQADEAFAGFSIFGPIKKAWKKFTDWFSKNAMGPLKKIGKSISREFDFGNPFKAIADSSVFKFIVDALKSIVDIGKKIWDFIGPKIIETGIKAWDALKAGFQRIKDAIQDFGKKTEGVGKVLNSFWEGLKIVFTALAALVMGTFSVLWGAVDGAIGPVITYITDFAANLIDIFGGVVEFLVGVFTLDWEKAWQGIKDIFAGLWNGIADIITGAWDIVVGLIEGVVRGVWDWMTWLYDELIGHSIIPDIVDGIVDWFKKLGSWLEPIWRAIATAIEFVWSSIIKPVFSAFGEVLSWLWNNVAKKIFSAIGTGFSALGTVFSAAWTGIVKPVFSAVGNVISWLWNNVAKKIFSAIGSGFGVLWTGVKAIWNNVGRPLFLLIASVVSSLWNNFAKPIFAALAAGFSVLWTGVKAIWGGTGKPLFDFIGSTIRFLWANVIKPSFEGIGNIFSWLWNSVGKKIFAALGSGFSALWAGVKFIWNSVIKPVFNFIGNAISWLWNAVGKKIFAALGVGFATLWAGVKVIWGSVIKPVLGAVGNLLSWLWNTVGKKIFAALGTGFATLWAGVKVIWTGVIQPLFSALGARISWLWTSVAKPTFKFIGDIFSWLWNSVGKKIFAAIGAGFATLWAGVKFIWGSVIKPVFNFIGNILSALWNNIAKPVFRAVATGWSLLWAGVKLVWQKIIWPVIDAIAKAGKFLWYKVLSPVFSFIASAFRLLWAGIKIIWHTVAKPVFDAIGAVAKWLWENVLLKVFDAIKAGFNFLGLAIRTVWVSFIKPTLELVAKVVSWLWNNVAKPVFRAIGNAFSSLWAGVKVIWQNVIKPVFDAIGGAAKWVWEKVLSPVWGFIKNAFSSLAATLYAVYNGTIRVVFDAFGRVVDGAKSVIGRAFDAIRGAWQSVVDTLLRFYDNRIKPMFSSMGHFIGNAIDGVKGTFWSLFAYFSDIKNRISDAIGGIVDRFRGMVNNFPSFYGLFDGIKNAFRTALNWIIDKWNGLHFKLGDFEIGTPYIQPFAKGGVTSGPYLAGEGKKQWPEFIIPTDPAYRSRATALYSKLGDSLFGDAKTGGVSSLTSHSSGGTVVNIGTVVLPNITSEEDAEELIKNLKALGG